MNSHGLETHIFVVTIAWVVCDAPPGLVVFETGATHWVHTVDTEVLSIVERTVVTCVIGFLPGALMVLVTGQGVIVVWTL